MGDLNKIPFHKLEKALHSDHYIVFGASFIKDELAEFLIRKHAVNIHMGISPFYRGSSCNFWASFDKNLSMVGATIHLISKGLDSGSILFHALPMEEDCPFRLGMRSVAAAHKGLVHYIKNNEIEELIPIEQDKSQEIRYTRNIDFNDKVAIEYLENLPTKEDIRKSINIRNNNKYINPFIY